MWGAGDPGVAWVMGGSGLWARCTSSTHGTRVRRRTIAAGNLGGQGRHGQQLSMCAYIAAAAVVRRRYGNDRPTQT